MRAASIFLFVLTGFLLSLSIELVGDVFDRIDGLTGWERFARLFGGLVGCLLPSAATFLLGIGLLPELRGESDPS